MITKALGGILVYSLVIYATITRGPSRDFYPIQIDPPEAAHNIGVFLLLGVALWIVYDIIKYLLKIITIPLNRFSLGSLHLVVNILILYVMPYVFTLLHTGVTIEMGNMIEVGIFAFLLSMLRGFIK